MSVHQPIVLSEEMLLATRFAGATRHPSPLVELWSMPGFLDPGECDILMRYIDANRRPSQIAYGAADARTSETCAFDPAAPVVQLLDLRLSLLLGIAPTDFAVDWNQVIFKMLQIKGIYGREMFETWYKMIALIQTGLDLSGLITHRISIDEFAEGFAAMRSGMAGKVVMDWG